LWQFFRSHPHLLLSTANFPLLTYVFFRAIDCGKLVLHLSRLCLTAWLFLFYFCSTVDSVGFVIETIGLLALSPPVLVAVVLENEFELEIPLATNSVGFLEENRH
jgi:hypothetical protein